jgi:ribosomal protein L31E
MTAPRTRRAKKAIFVLKAFIQKHMKCEELTISEELNEHIWSQGMRNPLMKVKVIADKDDKTGIVAVRLFGEEIKAPVVAKKKVEKASTPMGKLKEKVTDLKEAAAAPKEEAPKEEPAKVEEVKSEESKADKAKA